MSIEPLALDGALRPPYLLPGKLVTVKPLSALVVAALLYAGRASAEDKIEVFVTPKGQPWSIGRYGGAECYPTCTLRVPPDTYLVTMNETKLTLPIQVPTALTFEPGSPKLRKIAGWTALGVFVGAGALGALGIYGIGKACSDSGGVNCIGSSTNHMISKTAAEVLIVTAAGLITLSATAAIIFAVTGDGIAVRELVAPPDPPRRKSFDVMVVPSSNGASLSFVKQF